MAGRMRQPPPAVIGAKRRPRGDEWSEDGSGSSASAHGGADSSSGAGEHGDYSDAELEDRRLLQVDGADAEAAGGAADASSRRSRSRSRGSSSPEKLSTDDFLVVVYRGLEEEAKDEQLALAQGKLRDTPWKRNRRETYLDVRVRKKWMTRSRRFLERQRDAIAGLSQGALYSAALLQHLLELDAADFLLPETARRFEDTYDDGFNRQFVLDATRARFTVLGDVFHYETAPPDQDERSFVESLSTSVREAVPEALLPRVSTAMCQSGLAALEKATLSRAAVSGGRQEVDYELRVNGDVFLVDMQVHRRGFSHYMLPDEDAPLECDHKSSLRKSATVSFTAEGSIDVLVVAEVVDIISLDGEPVPLEPLLHDPFEERQTEDEAVSRQSSDLEQPMGVCRRICECLSVWRSGDPIDDAPGGPLSRGPPPWRLGRRDSDSSDG